MIYWAFLIPTFIAGFAAGCAFLYWLAGIFGYVDSGIDRMAHIAAKMLKGEG